MTEHPRRLVTVTCSTATGAPDGTHLSVAEWNDHWQEYLTGIAICGQSANQGELPQDTVITCVACEALRDTYVHALEGRPTAEQEQLATALARVAALEAQLTAERDAALHAPQLRHCLYPACLREFDAMATMSGRPPQRESWSGAGWLQMTATVGYVCPDHAHLVANDTHRPRWTRPEGEEQPAVLRCACDWASPPVRWPRYGVAAWQNHLAELQ